jgi:predicted nucleotidyltransferase
MVDALLELGVSKDVLTSFPRLASDVEALLIYGSRARGDAVSGSDIDLLALVTKSRPSAYTDNVTVSYYTGEQLSTGIGTDRGEAQSTDPG